MVYANRETDPRGGARVGARVEAVAALLGVDFRCPECRSWDVRGQRSGEGAATSGLRRLPEALARTALQQMSVALEGRRRLDMH